MITVIVYNFILILSSMIIRIIYNGENIKLNGDAR